MTALQGTYFDGSRSQGKLGSLTLRSVSAIVTVEDGSQISINLSELKVTAPLPGTPTRITWGDQQSFVTLDYEGVRTLWRSLPGGAGWADRVQRRMSTVVVALLLSVTLIAGLAIWGVPAGAARLAYSIPAEISQQMANLTINHMLLDLDSSNIDTGRQRELRRYLLSFEKIPQLEFRSTRTIGANALALSATTVVITDDLIELAETDEALLAIYFHECGHAQLRHVEQKVLRASAWLVFLTVVSGDLGSVGELLLTIPVSVGLSAYSREFEREADNYAVDRLLEAGISPEYMATILEKLEVHHLARLEDSDEESKSAGAGQELTDMKERTGNRGGSLINYLNSHPPTGERTAFIRSRVPNN